MDKLVGQTAAAGFQIGVRRTFPVAREQAWAFVTSPEGRGLWLGTARELRFEPGYRYETVDGTCGEIRIVKKDEQLRLTWQKKGWTKPSTLQIRFLSKSSDRTTISFHQEKLANCVERETMRLRWEAALDEFGHYLEPK